MSVLDTLRDGSRDGSVAPTGLRPERKEEGGGAGVRGEDALF